MQTKLNWLLVAEKNLEKCLELEPDYELASQGLEKIRKRMALQYSMLAYGNCAICNKQFDPAGLSYAVTFVLDILL